MSNVRQIGTICLLGLIMVGCGGPEADESIVDPLDRVHQVLPELGHRNWVVIADSAYPAQSRPGIETIYVGGDQMDTVTRVLEAIDASPHVQASVYVDSELDSVDEGDASGIGEYRETLSDYLKGRPVTSLPHERIIEKLDNAGKTFRILVLKTDMTLPYTTVFVELDCGYWSSEAERRLRRAVESKHAFP